VKIRIFYIYFARMVKLADTPASVHRGRTGARKGMQVQSAFGGLFRELILKDRIKQK